nr:lactoylglutathione lyase-like [Physcomitrium patens]|eukprot:XP_024373221.1 lactoylglutathione lyase-like [Physcomitrella patens]
MKLIARKDFPAQKKAFAYLSYDMDKRRSTVLEFEYNYDKTNYSKGNGYAQLAIGTEDIYKTYEACEIIDGGQTVTIPTTSPNTNTKIYAVIDPDGWRTVWVDNSDFTKELEPVSFAHEFKCTTQNKKQQL